MFNSLNASNVSKISTATEMWNAERRQYAARTQGTSSDSMFAFAPAPAAGGASASALDDAGRWQTSAGAIRAYTEHDVLAANVANPPAGALEVAAELAAARAGMTVAEMEAEEAARVASDAAEQLAAAAAAERRALAEAEGGELDADESPCSRQRAGRLDRLSRPSAHWRRRPQSAAPTSRNSRSFPNSSVHSVGQAPFGNYGAKDGARGVKDAGGVSRGCRDAVDRSVGIGERHTTYNTNVDGRNSFARFTRNPSAAGIGYAQVALTAAMNPHAVQLEYDDYRRASGISGVVISSSTHARPAARRQPAAAFAAGVAEHPDDIESRAAEHEQAETAAAPAATTEALPDVTDMQPAEAPQAPASAPKPMEVTSDAYLGGLRGHLHQGATSTGFVH